MTSIGDRPDLRLAAEPGEEGQVAVDGLVRLLDLERLEEDLFRGVSPKVSMQRVFGGQVAGQALVAAVRTVDPDRYVHSLHSYFLRPGDPTIPIIYTVERVRDGRSFSTRRVEGIQHGKPIFYLSASFCVPEEGGFSHSDPMPDAPEPDSIPRYAERVHGHESAVGPQITLPRPIDLRYVSSPPWERDGRPQQVSQIWMRVDGDLPDDPALHACALTFASDLTLLDASLGRQGLSWVQDEILGASLDHALWFHQPFRADEWFLYQSVSPSASNNRGFNIGQIFSRGGRLVASTAQEGLVRRRR